jgi:3-oxoacyl-[acyl-carrier protein] reductase
MNKKIAVVTGNAKGLGLAISENLAQHGYLRPETIFSKDYDLNKASNAEKLIQGTIDKYSQIDLLINNVGNYIAKDIDEMSIEEWHEMMNSNLNSAFYMCKYALPYLRQSQGSIINIGFASLEKFSPAVRVIAYQVAKTGLLTLTKGLAKAEAPKGVLINMISPGHLENTIVNNAMNEIPLGRLGRLEEINHTINYLLNNKYITGQNIEVAGAWGL